ncbi:transposase [Acetobacter senegalensis DSM 18889]|nr:transposase [Acetobacter senegalensis DSM 18889]
MKQPGFFDIDERLARLSGLGDQLEAFSQTVDFEVFRPDLELTLAYSDGSKGGRPPFDPVLMFKILVIQTLNNLSDERTEYLVNDRLSFMRFLGLGLSDRVPDAKTVWLFRERLTQAGAIERLFDRFDATLRNAGYLPMSGQDVFQKTGRTSPQRCHTRIVMHDGHLSLRRRSGRTMEPYRRAISPFRSLATNHMFPSIGSFGSSELSVSPGPP